MPDPKPKKRPVLSTDPDDILKTVNRDYPAYNARYLGQSAGDRAEFEMTGKTNGSSFTLDRGSAFPAVDPETAKKNREIWKNRNKNQ